MHKVIQELQEFYPEMSKDMCSIENKGNNDQTNINPTNNDEDSWESNDNDNNSFDDSTTTVDDNIIDDDDWGFFL